MIAYLEGPVVASGTDYLVVNAGGVGLRAEVPSATATRFVGNRPTSETARIHTALVVREDSLTLYGFESPAERDVFETLLGVSGIGPRLALAAINQLGADGLRRAVFAQDVNALSQISGVGKKTAQRMVLEIGDKLGAPAEPAGDTGRDQDDQMMRDLVKTTLEQYGLTRTVAGQAVDSLDGHYTDMASMLRDAFARAGNGRG